MNLAGQNSTERKHFKRRHRTAVLRAITGTHPGSRKGNLKLFSVILISTCCSGVRLWGEAVREYVTGVELGFQYGEKRYRKGQ
jgi:hypothetical protein